MDYIPHKTWTCMCVNVCRDKTWLYIMLLFTVWFCFALQSLIARFMRSTWGPSGANRTQVCPMLAPWTLISGMSVVTHSSVTSSMHSRDKTTTPLVTDAITMLLNVVKAITESRAVSFGFWRKSSDMDMQTTWAVSGPISGRVLDKTTV